MREASSNWTPPRLRGGSVGCVIKTAVATLGLISGIAAGTAPAAVLVEAGDAGDLPGTAQLAAGVAPSGTPLDAITGVAQDCGVGSCDQDMFKIYISDPANFSASTNNSETLLDDTMLYVFDGNGRGVLATDDIDGFNYKSSLAAGSLGASPAGVYYLAVSKGFNTPVSGLPADESKEIFIASSLGGATTAIGATGGGAANPVVGWYLFPLDDAGGAYRINLTGATFLVPEPGFSLMIGCGAVCLAGLANRQSRRLRA